MKGFFHRVIGNLGQYSPFWAMNMSEYLLWLLSYGVTLCAYQGNASPHEFLSFHWSPLVTTQYIWLIQGWYSERKKKTNQTNKTHMHSFFLFLCLSARSVEHHCSFYNIADTSVTRKRFCRTPLLCFWLPCRRRQQHGQDEERRAGLLPAPKARCVLVSLCPSHSSSSATQTAECHTLPATLHGLRRSAE